MLTYVSNTLSHSGHFITCKKLYVNYKTLQVKYLNICFFSNNLSDKATALCPKLTDTKFALSSASTTLYLFV